MDENTDNNTMWLWLGVGVVVLVGGYLLLQQGFSTKAPQTIVTPASTSSPSANMGTQSATATSGAMVKETMVTVTSAGFSPETVTIKAGETVKWTNNDTADHHVASSVHPSHLLYPALNLGVVKPKASVMLKFPTAGTYKYHDHLHPSLSGVVVVQ